MGRLPAEPRNSLCQKAFRLTLRLC